ncbi:MAG: sirohydrochlorin cobaltochelatase [Desulfovibrio sp.]|nr:sirohydrochlorin cobaltochelatase [Desulfovibrio sp.]
MRKALLLVAYGASNPASRFALAGFEARCRGLFPGIPIRWAYTSTIMRERLARQRQKSDSVAKALTRLYFEKYDAIAIQPLHLIAGREYEEVRSAVESARSGFGLACALGAPLLAADTGKVARALLEHLPCGRKPGEDVIFMAHGARHSSEQMYFDLAAEAARLDPHIHIGTMSGSLALEAIIAKLRSRVVWLLPLLSSVGLHAVRDMAGPDEQSWRGRIEASGRTCRPVLSGMVEGNALAGIWIEHLAKAVGELG